MIKCWQEIIKEFIIANVYYKNAIIATISGKARWERAPGQ